MIPATSSSSPFGQASQAGLQTQLRHNQEPIGVPGLDPPMDCARVEVNCHNAIAVPVHCFWKDVVTALWNGETANSDTIVHSRATRSYGTAMWI